MRTGIIQLLVSLMVLGSMTGCDRCAGPSDTVLEPLRQSAQAWYVDAWGQPMDETVRAEFETRLTCLSLGIRRAGKDPEPDLDCLRRMFDQSRVCMAETEAFEGVHDCVEARLGCSFSETYLSLQAECNPPRPGSPLAPEPQGP